MGWTSRLCAGMHQHYMQERHSNACMHADRQCATDEHRLSGQASCGLCREAARALETVQPDALYQDPLAETLAGADAMDYVRNTSMGVNPKVWRSKWLQTDPGTKQSKTWGRCRVPRRI